MSNAEELKEALADVEYRFEQGSQISPPYYDRPLAVLADAARERLAQLEVNEGVNSPAPNASLGGQDFKSDASVEKVWKCAVHHYFGIEVHCDYWELSLVQPDSPCQMVEKQLAPIDALVVVKENGEWPKWATEILGHDVAMLAECEPNEILHALQAAQSGGE